MYLRYSICYTRMRSKIYGRRGNWERNNNESDDHRKTLQWNIHKQTYIWGVLKQGPSASLRKGTIVDLQQQTKVIPHRFSELRINRKLESELKHGWLFKGWSESSVELRKTVSSTHFYFTVLSCLISNNRWCHGKLEVHCICFQTSLRTTSNLEIIYSKSVCDTVCLTGKDVPYFCSKCSTSVLCTKYRYPFVQKIHRSYTHKISSLSIF